MKKDNPWPVAQGICYLLFFKQLFSLIQQQMNPNYRVVSKEVRMMHEIEFPVVFKFCFKPSINQTALHELGYADMWSYMMGQSMYNKSLFGWAGHNSNGSVVSNVEGS